MRWVHIFNRLTCRWEWLSIPIGIKIAAFTGIGLCAGMVPLFWPSAPLPPPVVAAPSPGVAGPFPPAWGVRPVVAIDGAYGPDRGVLVDIHPGEFTLVKTPEIIWRQCVAIYECGKDQCSVTETCDQPPIRPTPEPGGLFAVGLAMVWVVRWVRQSR